mmetsp:Transcript_26568/g.74644  ORF Transcript_26568/g.74644 Transcript_26568/m.74644 type:complete len:251 (-) Transcript_26568:353-1105(-)|eukprot:CAMPEP_0117663424 /NCGR_PEP_ID=MMETSP0804-20121206/8598_1 /TAXON_ID=1074897 /ORGANISM="Tetraselmis astigmatica, Strain CCMP880" /LENGTH=250 /DNA_ID=CAMNT_0005470427 /DNA_START=436 /DNA_END=1188 /DNA_ORIENTATION=-
MSSLESILMDANCQSLLDVRQAAQCIARNAVRHARAISAGEQDDRMALAALRLTGSMLRASTDEACTAALSDCSAIPALCASLQGTDSDRASWNNAAVVVISSMVANSRPLSAIFQQQLLDALHGAASVAGLLPEAFEQPSSPSVKQSKTEIVTICSALEVLTSIVERPGCPVGTVRHVLVRLLGLKECRSDAVAALKYLEEDVKDLYGISSSQTSGSSSKLSLRRIAAGGFGNSHRKFTRTRSKSGYTV